MDFLSWFFGGTTVVGLLSTIYYGRKSNQLEIARKKIEWADMQSCASDMGSEIKKSFLPEVIYAPNLRAATFANLLSDELDRPIPVFVGIVSSKAGRRAIPALQTCIAIETSKLFVLIPDSLLQFKDQSLLIVDDFSMSGDTLEKLKQMLIANGFVAEKIKTACMATTRVAVHSHKGPDFFWMQTPDDNFYFPWGKAK